MRRIPGDPYDSTYFFEQAGLAVSNAFTLTVGLYAAAFVGTVGSWLLLTYVGRRRIFVVGLGCLSVGMFLIGGLSVSADNGNVGARWGQSGTSPSRRLKMIVIS